MLKFVLNVIHSILENKEKQVKLEILKNSKCDITITKDYISIAMNEKTKQLEIYPAMCKKGFDGSMVRISDAMIKYAKPYAVKRIIDQMKW